MKFAPLLLVVALTQAAPPHPAPPTAREIAPDTYLLPGSWLPDRGPDGTGDLADPEDPDAEGAGRAS